MNSSLLIISQNRDDAEKVRTMLTGTVHEIHVCQPSSLPSPAELPGLFLLLSTDDRVDLTQQIGYQQFPGHIPLLVIGEPQKNNEAERLKSPQHLVDYMSGPLDRNVLFAKVQFMKQVAKLGEEHTNYLQGHNKFLDWFTSHDGLTGLYNRHHFNKIFGHEYEKAVNAGKDLSILVLDIDYFSEINRSCRHSFGDFVLNELSARVTKSTRQEDLCFRFTGGDFVVLMPEADLATARQTANRIRNATCQKTFSRNETERNVTISIGIASTLTHHPHSKDEIINMAEMALYQAKAEGRNRCCIYAPSENKPLKTATSQRNLESLKTTISRLLEKTRNSAIASLQLLAKDIAGEEHRQHLEKVTHYTGIFGKQLGLTPTIIQTLQNAIILQSSIRLLMHSELISKPIQLDESDRRILKDLPYKIAEVTEIFDYFDNERAILLTRSENYDGTGFPDGLSGDEIPLGSRIISIVDSFAAMDSDRPFRSKLDPKSILEELKNEAGKQFDPVLVLKLIDIIEDNNLLELSSEQLQQSRTELINTYPELRI